MVTSPTAGEGKATTLSNTYGMAEILLSGEGYSKALNKTENTNLFVITAGKIPSNPSELLYSNAMKNLIDSMKQEFDYIFIDAPPVVPVTDSAIMSTYVDGTILVCSSGNIDIELAQRAKESLEKVNANILGVVLNKVSLKNNKYSDYYYYYGEEEKS